MRIWTPEDERVCVECKTMRELADHGVSVLHRLRSCVNDQQIHQICGPMSTGGFGDLDKNMLVFQHCIDIAIERGLVVFDQLPFQNAMKRIVDYEKRVGYAQEILDVFYSSLFCAGVVNCAMFLPTWNTSRGAVWERQKIHHTGTITIAEYDLGWYDEAVRRAGLAE